MSRASWRRLRSAGASWSRQTAPLVASRGRREPCAKRHWLAKSLVLIESPAPSGQRWRARDGASQRLRWRRQMLSSSSALKYSLLYHLFRNLRCAPLTQAPGAGRAKAYPGG